MSQQILDRKACKHLYLDVVYLYRVMEIVCCKGDIFLVGLGVRMSNY